MELLREIGRLDTDGYADNAAGKASGIKNVAPFLSELAAVRPRVVLSNISLLLPHLDSEPYVLRSAIINSIGHILVREDHSLVETKEDKEEDPGDENGGEESNREKEERQMVRMAKIRNSLFDILCDRTHDITSFTGIKRSGAHVVERDQHPGRSPSSVRGGLRGLTWYGREGTPARESNRAKLFGSGRRGDRERAGVYRGGARSAGEEGDHPAGCVFHPVDHGVAGRGSIESICHACHLHGGWR
mmetsp:Transcript_13343/g.28832  ORF Transcript_13343/g.28832 Transcript_13343/m.28832 type:complete len:245 (-) Transcript_13343:1946-2680(-)